MYSNKRQSLRLAYGKTGNAKANTVLKLNPFRLTDNVAGRYFYKK